MSEKKMSARESQISAFAEAQNVSKPEAKSIIETYEAVLQNCMNENQKISLAPFGEIILAYRKPRTAPNPQNRDETINVEEAVVPRLKVHKSKRDLYNTKANLDILRK